MKQAWQEMHQALILTNSWTDEEGRLLVWKGFQGSYWTRPSLIYYRNIWKIPKTFGKTEKEDYFYFFFKGVRPLSIWCPKKEHDTNSKK